MASYAPGYDWQDGIEHAIKQQLEYQCHLKTFYMNSAQIQNSDQLEQLGLKAKEAIEKNNPDIVIVSDENAVKYVLEAYFRNHSLPFVFCGLNNSGKLYGLPYSNTTGMLEIAPTKTFLELLLRSHFKKPHVAYLTTQGTTASKNIQGFHQAVKLLKVNSSTFRAYDQQDWRQLYRQLQENSDVNIIILGNFIALPEWDSQRNLQWVKMHQQKLTISTQIEMMPYAALGMTKSATEQGTWAGKTALAVLNDVPINQLSIVPNQQFTTWINPLLSATVQDQIPRRIMNQAIHFNQALNP